tara:strand:- start:202 stop:498 length:297 start_codon:yes stop_codon:yes gene_type:complete
MKPETSFWYYDLQDSRYGEMLSDDMELAIKLGHVSSCTLLMCKDEYDTLLRYMSEFGYDYQDARDAKGNPEWWYLHFTFILPQLLDPMHDVGKEEDDE